MSFFRRSWLNRMFKGLQDGGQSTTRHRTFRPSIEALEERQLLANFTVTKPDDDGTMNTFRWAYSGPRKLDHRLSY